MRKLLLIVIVIFLLILDSAAIHDIIKGEPDTKLEYGFIIFSLLLFGGMIFYCNINKKIKT